MLLPAHECRDVFLAIGRWNRLGEVRLRATKGFKDSFLELANEKNLVEM